MKAVDRILQYIESKNIKVYKFEREVGLSNGYLKTQSKRNADMGEGVLVKIINNCPEIDALWLLTGKNSVVPSGDRATEILLGQVKELIIQVGDQAKEIGRLEEEVRQLKKGSESTHAGCVADVNAAVFEPFSEPEERKTRVSKPNNTDSQKDKRKPRAKSLH